MSEKQQATINKAKSTISIFSSNFSIPESVLAQEINSEVVLLHMDSESYYSLNAVGSRMWQMLTQSGDLEGTIKQLLRVFFVDETKLRQDVTALVEELVEEDLLTKDVT
ncbi:PqqD family protein [Rivularia sp. UHCC 0363]|uniref:PqqD family protein n=1 Tax=Rivularia sp. UHCC 0363 TaxID=3110244 RepID=UPI002B1F15A4|nr:PqqD family protein [Rivularia sp. UHCC 0363]MEA5593421.1 PqqD family protein [Rivularia sp. UHCC 0363]